MAAQLKTTCVKLEPGLVSRLLFLAGIRVLLAYCPMLLQAPLLRQHSFLNMSAGYSSLYTDAAALMQLAHLVGI